MHDFVNSGRTTQTIGKIECNFNSLAMTIDSLHSYI